MLDGRAGKTVPSTSQIEASPGPQAHAQGRRWRSRNRPGRARRAAPPGAGPLDPERAEIAGTPRRAASAGRRVRARAVTPKPWPAATRRKNVAPWNSAKSVSSPPPKRGAEAKARKARIVLEGRQREPAVVEPGAVVGRRGAHRAVLHQGQRDAVGEDRAAMQRLDGEAEAVASAQIALPGGVRMATYCSRLRPVRASGRSSVRGAA